MAVKWDQSSPDDALSPTEFIEINRICDRFEAAWRAGQRPLIEAYLAGAAEPLRSELLRELLATELELRRSAGEQPRLAEYRARFPASSALLEAEFGRMGSPPPAAVAPTSHDAADTARNLLFGLVALQNNFIDRDALVAAFGTWVADKSKSLGAIVVAQGALDGPRLALVEALAAEHLKLHGGDPQQSLAALAVGSATRESLQKIGDPRLDASLSHAGAATITGGPDSVFPHALHLSETGGQRFRVLRPHAHGGLGAVFVALDSELNREVALKQILDRHADDPANRARFVMEAEITGRLEHPGIVPVYGLGTYADGRPYYAMRFVRGDSLKEAIAAFHADATLKADPGRRSLELRKLVRRYLDVCNAVDYAHSRGVLHRDIKPGNVIVGKYGETLVVDWGLAKPLGRREPSQPADEQTLRPSSPGGSAETSPGSALGTPAFMSPEQAAGELHRLGPRSDVYSLGATLYCLLTGKPPQEGDDIGEILRKVGRGEFPPPRQLEPSLDPALEAVCLKAMATKPEDRYGSARALVEEIERWMADEPVSAWREPLSRRAQRWARQNRPLVTAAVAAVLVALAGLGAVLAVQRGANRTLAARNADLDRANISLREAIQQKDAANAALGEANERVQARFDLAREAIRSFKEGVEEEDALKENRLRPLRDKLLGSARRFYDRLGDLLKGQTDAASKAVLAESYMELAGLIERIGQKPEAREAYKKAVAIRRELAARPVAGAAERVKLAEALNALGEEAFQIGDHAGSLAAHEDARGLAEPLAAGPRTTLEARRALGSAHQGAGHALHATGKVAEALAAFGRAREVREALARDAPALPEDRIRLARTVGWIGDTLERTGDLAGALAEQRRGNEVLRGLAALHPAVSDHRSDLATSHIRVGGLLETTGDLAGALAEQRKALELNRALAAEHPAVPDYRQALAASHNWVGGLLEKTGDLAGALAEQRANLELMRALAAEHPEAADYRRELAVSHNRVGSVLKKTGDLAGALAEQRRTQHLTRALSAEHPEVPHYRRELAVSHNWVGGLLEETGDLAGALAEQRSSLEILRALAAEHPEIADYRWNLAVTHTLVGTLLAKTGDPAGAMAKMRKCQDLFRALAAEHPEVPDYRRELAVSHNRIGGLLEATGDLAGALAEQRENLELSRALAAEHPEVLDNRLNLAVSHIWVGAALQRADDLAGALAEYRKGAELIRALVAEHPEVPNYRRNLAASYSRVGALAEATGDLAGALAEQRRYLELMQALAVEYPGVPEYRRGLAGGHCRVGSLLTAAGRPAEALAELERARTDLEALAQAAPNVPTYRDGLASALNWSGDALRDLGRAGEARDRHVRAVALAEALASGFPKEPAYRGHLADSLRRLARLKLDAGDAAGADAGARRAVTLLEALPSLDGREWFWLACCRATLAATAGRDVSGTSAALATGLSDQAMNDLRRAAAKGYRSAAVYRHEPALGPLRGRGDFQLLMMDLSMPDKAFARAD